jgi:hypothetical protein
MARVLVGVQGNSRSPSSTPLPSLHEYPGCMPDTDHAQAKER